MKIAVASGKGGTGKTTVSANLSAVTGIKLYDFDVEEPNAKIFFKGNEKSRDVYRPVPEVKENCTLCGVCREVCQYNAIVVLKDSIMIFHEICHSCGACVYLCPEKAMDEVKRKIGEIIDVYKNGKCILTYGKMDIGEVSPVPIIKEMKKDMEKNAIIDCPPGASCPMVESVKTADFVVLVAEPTPFSFHDLKIAANVVKELKKPFGVVINKYGLPYNIEERCKKENYEIIGKIPFDRKFAEKYSKGELIKDKEMFGEIYDRILEIL